MATIQISSTDNQFLMAVIQAAAAEKRSVSGYCKIAIAQKLAQDGYILPAADAQAVPVVNAGAQNG